MAWDLLLRVGMNDVLNPSENVPAKPICVGLTCWLWQTNRAEKMKTLAQRLGVNLKLKQVTHGLYREIQAEVSGRNVDRFIGEFARLA